MVSLLPLPAAIAFAFSLLKLTRSSSSAVISASSNWVTCGIIAQLRARLAPEIFWIRDSGLLSIAPNLAKSTFGHGSKLSPPPAATGTAGARSCSAPDITAFTWCWTSSRLMRPFRPRPLTCNKSTPSSRAYKRTAGLAYGTLAGNTASASKRIGGMPGWPGSATGARAGTGAPLSTTATGAGAAATAGFDGAGTGAATAAGAAAGAAASAASAATSMIATKPPSDTLSPSLTLSSLITPAKGDGTSMVALSDSNVTKP